MTASALWMSDHDHSSGRKGLSSDRLINELLVYDGTVFPLVARTAELIESVYSTKGAEASA